LGLLPASCTTQEPSNVTYFQETIAPILTTSCVRTNTGAGCHVADAKGNAFGNLDLSSYAGVNARRDLLQDYGPYGQPSLLVKNVPDFQITAQLYDGTEIPVMTDIKHSGLQVLDPTASAYQVLRRWIENGASENNSGPPPTTTLRLPCTTTVPANEPGFDPNNDPTTADFAEFKASVNPIFTSTCGAGNCHGTTVNELYLTCGSTPQQVRWNYYAAVDYLAQNPEQAELVRRPLAPSQGGSFHEGGVIFQTTTDPNYEALLKWATAHGPPLVNTTGTCGPDSPGACTGFTFFAHRIQPILARKGCMMLQCHSAAMFHDYRLRGGSGGSFSLEATLKNYSLSIMQLALESPDVMASRIVRKNLFRPELSQSGHQPGLAHRGGPLFEDFDGVDANGSLCDNPPPSEDGGPTAPYDYDNGSLDEIPALCMIREWHRRERAQRLPSPISAIVYVKRTIPTDQDRAQDFDVYSGGAELHLAGATEDPTTGAVSLTGTDTVLNTGCGLDPALADIKRPSVSWDGTQVAFAARNSATAPLQVYVMNADGTSCALHAAINAGGPSANGVLIHNFDPAFSPPDDNGNASIVFASTRGNIPTTPYDYSGPQMTPADPSKPNANLYVYEPDPTNPAVPAVYRVRQQTFLLNMERYPSFMIDGRVISTTEKRAPNFYELALRRQNLDGSDYHPLFSQRGSIGYVEAREVVELADKDFAVIMSDQGTPHAGGTLAIFNRSIGIDFTSLDPTDYPIDPTVINPAAPASPEPSFFLHSLSFPDVSVSGHKGVSTTGAYTHPSPLPDGDLLVSFGAATDVGTFGGDYDIYVFNRTLGTKTLLIGGTGTDETDAVAVYARVNRGIFQATGDEPNAFTTIHQGAPEADVTILDTSVLGSLLFQNTPTGRLLESMDQFDLYEDMPPAAGVTSFATAPAQFVANDAYGQVYVRRRLMGHVPIAGDASSHFVTFGGLPLVMHLPDTSVSTKMKLPRYQREELEFAPGEYMHSAFQAQFFNNLCAFCHGAISGHPVDNQVAPDILTQASDTQSRTSTPTELRVPPSQRGPIVGPPATP
jgi:hypothetical protein